MADLWICTLATWVVFIGIVLLIETVRVPRLGLITPFLVWVFVIWSCVFGGAGFILRTFVRYRQREGTPRWDEEAPEVASSEWRRRGWLIVLRAREFSSPSLSKMSSKLPMGKLLVGQTLLRPPVDSSTPPLAPSSVSGIELAFPRPLVVRDAKVLDDGRLRSTPPTGRLIFTRLLRMGEEDLFRKIVLYL